MSGFSRFIPISKIDEATRMVYGVATDETIDGEDEIIDYQATKRAVEEWKVWANIREMHGASAAGVAKEIILDDAALSLFLGVYVADDQAWHKCLTGVYKGFSIGGKALKKITEARAGRIIRRTVDYILIEISLVDRPMNPSARFSLVKREGSNDMPEEEVTSEEETKAEGDPTEEEGGEKPTPDETDAEEGEVSMTAAMTRNLIIEVLKEVGLVREAGEGQAASPFAQAADVADLKKSLEGWKPDTYAPLDELTKVSGLLTKLDAAMTDLTGNFAKLLSDLATVAGAIDTLEDRLEIVEKSPAPGGPVLREINLMGAGPGLGGHGEQVLKSLIDQADDPGVRQVLTQQLTLLQIRTVHQAGGGTLQYHNPKNP